MIEKLRQIVRGLNTYRGRDASVRIICFINLFLHGILNYSQQTSNLSDAFLNASKQFANCRVIMRFFDDLTAILNFIEFYYSKKSEKKPLFNTIRYVNLISGFLYNVFEHLAWLADLKVTSLDRNLWWTCTFSVWATGLFSSLILNLRILWTYRQQQKLKSKREDDPKQKSKTFISLNAYNQAYLFALRDFSDFIIAINCLPSGFLWSSTLGPTSIGLLGAFASYCRVYYFVWKAD